MGIGYNSPDMLWCPLQRPPSVWYTDVIINQLIKRFICRSHQSMVVSDSHVLRQTVGTGRGLGSFTRNIKGELRKVQIEQRVNLYSLSCTFLIKSSALIVVEIWEVIQKVEIL